MFWLGLAIGVIFTFIIVSVISANDPVDDAIIEALDRIRRKATTEGKIAKDEDDPVKMAKAEGLWDALAEFYK